ncbi:DoxX family protein [Ammoniphilus resinae]|uniref:Membrane protein YphA (DoxX/SURF4 family) n=1 Tax=Ammoniphilus resinae TaxID=861532 RepID=A0ABS4GPL8_9BACL|nr:DoxX family protein [Ammoniphilus resinae]MBP1932223.1 putative membrane protein YphA (DoxX/SURF4 family) [Ammoniphilus resinae]
MVQKYEWSLFILRVVLGITFFIHGLAKFQMGLGNVAGWFESMGLMGFLGYAVALIELLGGIALILGFGTQVASALISLVMLGAIFTAKLSAGFMGNGQSAGYELDLALLAMAVALTITGSRLYAMDKMFESVNKEKAAA